MAMMLWHEVMMDLMRLPTAATAVVAVVAVIVMLLLRRAGQPSSAEWQLLFSSQLLLCTMQRPLAGTALSFVRMM